MLLARNKKPCVWGIVNVTPDSFSDGGLCFDAKDAIAHGRRLFAEGAAVVDVGGASSRPAGFVYGAGAEPVQEDEECRRVLPVIRELSAYGQISVDTTSAAVAEAALQAGASVVNDVSGARDADLLRCVARHRAAYVLMHTRRQGQLSHGNTDYQDVRTEVVAWLEERLEMLTNIGLDAKRIVIDPGLGFAKTPAQSMILLAHFDALVALGFPVMLAASRKAFLARPQEHCPGSAESSDRCDSKGPVPEPSLRWGSSIAAAFWAGLQGATVFRVHDVAATCQALELQQVLLRWYHQAPVKR